MSNQNYIDDDGNFIGTWTKEDVEEFFSNPENSVKKLIVNRTFGDLSWLRLLKDVEELCFGHWKTGSWEASDVVLDLGLLPHNPNRSKFKISFNCTLKSLLNWWKTDATDLSFGELWLGPDAEEHGFVSNPEEKWGERVQSITIYEQRATIQLQNFQDKSLKYYHDEQFRYSRDKIALDYLGSCGEVFSWLEDRYTKNPELITTAKEVQIIGDHQYHMLHASNKIFTLLRTESINTSSEDDDAMLELEESGDEGIQKFVNSLPSWPCTIYFSNLGIGPAELPKTYAALRAKGHTLNGK